MSDPLASFFAKKDKKKSGRKSTSTRSDEQTKSNKEKDVTVNAGPILRNILQQDEGEWNDYEEQTEKDYSDLKIQTLSFKDREEEFREQKALEARLARQALQSENGGPWSRKSAVEQPSESSAASGEQQPTEESKPEEEKPKANEPTRYIPPHERHQAQAVSLKPTNARNKVAPEIKNEIEFPTLGKVATK